MNNDSEMNQKEDFDIVLRQSLRTMNLISMFWLSCMDAGIPVAEQAHAESR